jgi:hypothetical protein
MKRKKNIPQLLIRPKAVKFWGFVFCLEEEKVIAIDDFFKLADEEGGVYEIETPQGWVEIGSLVKKIDKECFTIRTKTGHLQVGVNEQTKGKNPGTDFHG